MNFKLMNFRPAWRVILPLLLAFAACGARAEKAAAPEITGLRPVAEPEITGPQPVLETKIISIHTASGAAVPIKAELARTDREKQAGLMFRKELADGSGMLFMFENDEVHSFWMKNTLIPLSVAFILRDGTILEIKDLYPRDLSSVHSSRSVRYALEAPQGWFTRAGIKAGDRLDLSAPD
jgi:uncharacterized membrane protein (UPF0127 family)